MMNFAETCSKFAKYSRKFQIQICKLCLREDDARVDLENNVISWSRGVCKGRGIAKVGDEIACEADMMITIPEILESYLPKR